MRIISLYIHKQHTGREKIIRKTFDPSLDFAPSSFFFCAATVDFTVYWKNHCLAMAAFTPLFRGSDSLFVCREEKKNPLQQNIKKGEVKKKRWTSRLQHSVWSSTTPARYRRSAASRGPTEVSRRATVLLLIGCRCSKGDPLVSPLLPPLS